MTGQEALDAISARGEELGLKRRVDMTEVDTMIVNMLDADPSTIPVFVEAGLRRVEELAEEQKNDPEA